MTIKQLEDWLVRLQEEYVELNDKLNKLNNFIVSDSFRQLNVIQQTLLDQQRLIMLEYSDILKQRINTSNFDPTPSNESVQERIDFLNNRF